MYRESEGSLAATHLILLNQSIISPICYYMLKQSRMVENQDRNYVIGLIMNAR